MTNRMERVHWQAAAVRVGRRRRGDARPGEWGRYLVGHADKFAHDLRSHGLEATARGPVVYFRAPGGDAA